MTPPAQVLIWGVLAAKYASTHPILNPNEVLAVIWSESWGNPQAINESDPSYGLMGVSMLIGRKFSDAQTPTDLYDPDTNVCAGAGFLAYLKDKYALRFPNFVWVQAYNCGEGNLLKGYNDSAYSEAFVSHLADLNALA